MEQDRGRGNGFFRASKDETYGIELELGKVWIGKLEKKSGIKRHGCVKRMGEDRAQKYVRDRNHRKKNKKKMY